MTMPDLEHALDALAGRVSSLRETSAAYPSDLAPTLDAALAELDTAVDVLAEAGEQPGRGSGGRSAKKGGCQPGLRRRRPGRRGCPVPGIGRGGGGMVRRINPAASRLLGSRGG